MVISVRFRVDAHPLRRSGLLLRVAWVHPSIPVPLSTCPIVDLLGLGDGKVLSRMGGSGCSGGQCGVRLPRMIAPRGSRRGDGQRPTTASTGEDWLRQTGGGGRRRRSPSTGAGAGLGASTCASSASPPASPSGVGRAQAVDVGSRRNCSGCVLGQTDQLFPSLILPSVGTHQLTAGCGGRPGVRTEPKSQSKLPRTRAGQLAGSQPDCRGLAGQTLVLVTPRAAPIGLGSESVPGSCISDPPRRPRACGAE